MKKYLLLAAGLVFALIASSVAYAQSDVKLRFTEGEMTRLKLIETLKLTMYQPGVDIEFIEPSVRMFDYSFTETVEKVNPDGSAVLSVRLDSFATTTHIGEGKGAEEFFRFNSSDDYDLRKNFRDIKTYPRAQFLGQNLRFTMGPDGMIRSFENLNDFKIAAQGKGFDYDFVRAILAMSDSLRLGQLLEQGFGAIPALSENTYNAPYTVTEIPVTRQISSRRKGDSLFVNAVYAEAPEKIEYLEGIAIPIELKKFGGNGSGRMVVKKGKLVWGHYQDSTMVDLFVDPDTIPYKAVREVTIRRSPIEVRKGVKVTIQEKEVHRGVIKTPELKVPEGAEEIDLPGTSVETPDK